MLSSLNPAIFKASKPAAPYQVPCEVVNCFFGWSRQTRCSAHAIPENPQNTRENQQLAQAPLGLFRSLWPPYHTQYREDATHPFSIAECGMGNAESEELVTTPGFDIPQSAFRNPQ